MSSSPERNEAARLEALHRLGILHEPASAVFDDLVELAAAICGVDRSAVTLVDETRTWIKASVGYKDIPFLQRESSLCHHVIQQDGILEVPDARLDHRFSQWPQVVNGIVRFYAGISIHSPEKLPVGALCVTDSAPRQLTEAQQAAMRVLAAQATGRIELHVQRRRMEAALAAAEQARLSAEEARAALAASDIRFNTFMNSGPFLSFLKGPDGRMLHYNRQYGQMYGSDQTALLGKLDEEMYGAEVAADFARSDDAVRTSGSLQVLEQHSRGADGVLRAWRCYKFPCIDADGGVSIGGIALDVTAELDREAALRSSQAELERANRRLEELARTDSLTGLANRRAFEERFAQELAISRRARRRLSVIMLDVDNFKLRNDRYGHAAGDATLKQLARLLPQSLRDSDLAARFGGEEFVVLLPDTGPEGALRVAENVLTAIRAAAWDHIPVTSSAGVASLGRDASTASALLSLADQALYAAKRTGKDRVIAWGDHLATTAVPATPGLVAA